MVAENTQLNYTKIALTTILSFQHLGHEGCCFHILTRYDDVREGYASYGFL